MHRIRQSIQFYGRVQGVGFRYKLGYLADKYSVTGWARNEYGIGFDRTAGAGRRY